VNIPDLVDRVFVMTRLAAGIADKDALTAEDKTEYLIEKGSLESATATLQSDFEHAIRGSADGSVKAHLEARYAAVAERLRRLLAADDDAVLGKTGKSDAAAVTAPGRAALGALRDLHAAAAADLDRLLTTRIDGFMTDRLVKFAITLLLFVITFAMGGRYVATGVVWPVEGMTEAMAKLADGDHEADIPGAEREDEIGRMARAVLVFKDNMIRARQLAADQERVKAEAEAERGARLRGVSLELEGKTDTMKQTLDASGARFSAVAQSLSASAEQTESRAAAITAATEQASVNVESVASAAGQLSLSIREIGRQVAQSSSTAELASEEARRTDVTVRSLSESSARIGEVVQLINDIASQTNLLALNATIEAARAGEMGKGFAVVASEVKNLANQTAKATEEIAQQVTAVQAATQEAVQAIGAIGGRISDLHRIATTVATAVEEQAAATNEIAHNVRQASEGTREVANSIGDVTAATRETSKLSRQIVELTEARNRDAGAFFSQVFEMARSLRKTS